MPHPLRADIGGVSLSIDQLWRAEKGTVCGGFTVYNGEVTGCAPVFRKRVRSAGMNAGYVIRQLEKDGWKVEKVDETKTDG